MSKNRKQKKEQLKAFKSASTQFPLNPNITLGPESFDEETSSDSPDATSATNLDDDNSEIKYPATTAGLTEKYLLSGKYDVPIWRIAFILLAAASMFIFIQDNDSGALMRGDWWAIIWTIQKCLILSGFIFFLLIMHSISNWVRKMISNKLKTTR
jgi:hypothetical protein